MVEFIEAMCFPHGAGKPRNGRLKGDAELYARARIGEVMGTIRSMKRQLGPSPAARAEATRVQRIRADAKRPISVNLAEGIALSHKLMQFTGVARNVD